VAKITIKKDSINRISKEYRKKVINTLRADDLRQDIATSISTSLLDKPKDFGSAKEPYKSYRAKLSKKNTTAKNFNKNRIKALFTGELFEDLADKRAVRNKATSKGIEYEIQHTSRKHKKYKGTKGKRSKYRDISAGLYKLGYQYFNFTKSLEKKIIKIVNKKIRKALK
jgi:hypothetical protein